VLLGRDPSFRRQERSGSDDPVSPERSCAFLERAMTRAPSGRGRHPVAQGPRSLPGAPQRDVAPTTVASELMADGSEGSRARRAATIAARLE
jgi:hypothetical protein